MPEDRFAEEVRKERRKLGAVLRELREEHGLTQQEAASRIGITQSAMSRFESGERGFGIAELRIIARAYGKTLAELLARGLLSLL